MPEAQQGIIFVSEVETMCGYTLIENPVSPTMSIEPGISMEQPLTTVGGANGSAATIEVSDLYIGLRYKIP